MKLALIFTLFSFTALAGFSKPKLLARFMSSDAWNVPDNMWCFSGEPAAFKNKVYMNCMDEKGSLMATWENHQFSILARSENEQLFSRPILSFGKINWYEFTQEKVIRSYVSEEKVSAYEISNLGPLSEPSDSFLPYTSDSFFFKTKGETPQLWIWKHNIVKAFFNPMAAYIFTPQIGSQGEIALKTRDLHLGEDAPDRLWLYDNEWKVVLEDRDANPESPWNNFRHQLSVDGKKILLIASDGIQESLILIDDGKVEIVAKQGQDLRRFDHFTPKIMGNTIIVRGEDFDGRKAIYVKDDGPFRKLLAHGDVVHTDLGTARIDYKNSDALFYGSPGLDENGSVYIQATLSDIDYPTTLLGIGLILFHKE